MSELMTRGSCLCGTVRFTYAGAFDLMTHCHCGMCRKAHAAPFATYVMGARAPFRWDAGEAAIVARESSPGFVRSFCRHCGSVLPNTHLGKRVAIPAGLFDDDPGIRPAAHIFASARAPWFAITDDLPRHDYYPGAAAAAVERSPAPASTDGMLRGACLCGAVRYVVRGAFSAAYHCHCSRCRKARAAAHTTNGFLALDDFAIAAGADLVSTYRVPGARYFGQAFCRDCGSGVPRVDADRGAVIVPFGGLDDDPRRAVDAHIFVGSMAPWDAVTDTLPCCDGPPGG
ncbi:MAG: GFA family protein [Gammaproteobacteria bacterium]